MFPNSQILALLDNKRRRVCYRAENIEVLPKLTRLHTSDDSHHTVIFSSLFPDEADAAIEKEIEHHRGLGKGFEWKLYSHDNPPDLLDRLRCRGFQIGEQEAVMIFDLARRPEWMNIDLSQTVLRVDRLDQIPNFRRVAEAVFGKDYEFTANQLADEIAASSIEHRAYVAYAGATPVSIGRLYLHHDSPFGGLFGGGTLPEYRGKGFYRATIAARARDAVSFGAKYLFVDALPTSRPILEQLGFFHLTDTWPCTWQP